MPVPIQRLANTVLLCSRFVRGKVFSKTIILPTSDPSQDRKDPVVKERERKIVLEVLAKANNGRASTLPNLAPGVYDQLTKEIDKHLKAEKNAKIQAFRVRWVEGEFGAGPVILLCWK